MPQEPAGGQGDGGERGESEGEEAPGLSSSDGSEERV